MSTKNKPKKTNNTFSMSNLVQQIFDDIFQIAHHANTCISCQSKNIKLVDDGAIIYKCTDCHTSFSPKTQSLFQKVRYPNDKWIKLLTCMINDDSLETTVKTLQSSAESIKRRWTLVYENVDWEQYNILVRDKPTKNIYADFEVMIG